MSLFRRRGHAQGDLGHSFADAANGVHTIRLLELPVDWSKHIEESAKGSGQTCLGPVQSIQESKEMYDRATNLLKDLRRTTFIFVMRPEELSLYETLRASKELETIGIKAGEIIVNGILPEEVCEIAFFKKKYYAQQNVIRQTEKIITQPKRHMFLRDNEVKGTDALRDIAGELFTGKKPAYEAEQISTVQVVPTIDRPDIDALFLPGGQTKAIFFMGKGGVGKTSISCLVALHIAQKGAKILLFFVKSFFINAVSGCPVQSLLLGGSAGGIPINPPSASAGSVANLVLHVIRHRSIRIEDESHYSA